MQNNDSILVFEYYTAFGINNDEIISEAIAMIKSLLNDLIHLQNKNIYFLVSKDFEYIYNEIIEEKSDIIRNNMDNNINSIINNFETIVLEPNQLFHYLSNNVSNFDGVIFIASEENNNLYNITKIIEDNNVKIYGSNSEATKVCSDKNETFNHLKQIIPSPRTFKLTLEKKYNWKVAIQNIFEFIQDSSINNIKNKSKEKKLIAKPINGVDCKDVIIISSLDDIDNLDKRFPANSDILIQEFIEGDIVSVSLISNGDIAIPISLNKQYININEKEEYSYLGGELPYNHYLREKAFEIAKKSILAIPGIKGFIGVDLIINDNEIYFLEINSRFATPYVGLSKIANFNIGKYIVELLNEDISIDSFIEDLNFVDNNINKGIDFKENYVRFKKIDDRLDIKSNINNKYK